MITRGGPTDCSAEKSALEGSSGVVSVELHRGEQLVRKLIQIIVLGLSAFSVSASALEPGTNLHCTELQKLVVELSRTDIAPTREPLLREHTPERNYIWCLGIGFAALGKDQRPKAVILSFGAEPDGTIWLDFWEKRENPSFKWKGASTR